MGVIDVRTLGDVLSLPASASCDEVRIDTAGLKYAGLLPHALKYALWSTRPGGEILVHDNGPNEDWIAPWTIPFSLVRMLTFQFLGADTDTLDLDVPRHRIRLKRTRQVRGGDWQAGVIISGNEAEFPVLHEALAGLAAQPELAGPNRILVCGPNRDLGFLSGFPNVEYVEYDGPPTKPFAISRKKNALIDAMSAAKILVIHARIKLDPDVLRHAPGEFDFAAPFLCVGEGGRSKPHISYTLQDGGVPLGMGRASPLGSRQVDDPRRRLRRRRPFIDGGAFFADRESYRACPLNPHLGWGDAEDVEWCRRAEASGKLVDVWPQVTGRTMVDKLATPVDAPNAYFRAGQRAKRSYEYATRLGRHIAERCLGRR
ncbi:MAG: hypothetical protein MI723_11270 [Caulobacterales bacterium]|nr:hypothetical protein [Caulobacterales bacterium]